MLEFAVKAKLKDVRHSLAGPGFVSEIVVHEIGCSKDTDLTKRILHCPISIKIERHSSARHTIQRFQLRTFQSTSNNTIVNIISDFVT